MKVRFRASFADDLRRIKQPEVLKRVQGAVERVQRAEGMADIPNLRKLAGAAQHYRVRLGDYRIGLNIDRDVATFVRCLHRKDIYRYFP